MNIRIAQRVLLAVLLAVGFHAPAQTVDPATWGPYLPVIGTTRTASGGGYSLRWTWAQPGVELKEEYFTPSGRIAQTGTVTRGDRPGTLRYVTTALGGKEWSGKVQPDGSVLYVGTGLLKWHHRVSLSPDGVWEMRMVKLKDGAIVSMDEPAEANRYFPVDRTSATTAVATTAATGGAATAPVASPATQPAAVAGAAGPLAAAPTAVHASATGASLRGLERFVGKRMVEMEEGATIDFSRTADGKLVIQLGYRDGTPEGRYVLSESTGKPGTLDMHESAYGDAHRREAEWKSDSMLSVSSKNAILRGWIRGYDFIAEGDTLKVRRWGQLVTSIGATTDNSFDGTRSYIAAPGAPSLDPTELARQNALNERFFKAGSGPKAPRPGRWISPNGAVMWAPSSSGDRSIDRVTVLQSDGSRREITASAVPDPARGTWTQFENGKATGVHYATMGSDGSFEVRRLPELGVTPFDAVKAFHSVRFWATRFEIRRYDGSVDRYDWRAEGDALVAFEAAALARRVAYPQEQQRAAQLAAEQARQHALQQAQQELLDAQADAEFEAERQQRMAQWNQSRAASEQALADSVSRLNNTVANVEAQQAEYRARQEAQRLQQEAASRAADAQRAREATERQYEIARQFEARQQAQAQQEALARQQASATASAAVRGNAGGSASTRDRADSCVSPPLTSANKCPSSTGMRGLVTNQCAAPVDVRMCFMTDTGWSCQSEYGVDPGDQWHPGDCRANGQVFYSVRYSDSSEPLTSP